MLFVFKPQDHSAFNVMPQTYHIMPIRSTTAVILTPSLLDVIPRSLLTVLQSSTTLVSKGDSGLSFANAAGVSLHD